MKSLIIYFSQSGNTETIAKYIQNATGGELFKIEPANQYPEGYAELTVESMDRMESHEAPIKQEIPDISEYDRIYIGTPVYHDKLPEELKQAISHIDWQNKPIRFYVTHEGSGLTGARTQLLEVLKNANLINSIAFEGHCVDSLQSVTETWANLEK